MRLVKSALFLFFKLFYIFIQASGYYVALYLHVDHPLRFWAVWYCLFLAAMFVWPDRLSLTPERQEVEKAFRRRFLKIHK